MYTYAYNLLLFAFLLAPMWDSDSISLFDCFFFVKSRPQVFGKTTKQAKRRRYDDAATGGLNLPFDSSSVSKQRLLFFKALFTRRREKKQFNGLTSFICQFIP